jgi:hypothetical protein
MVVFPMNMNSEQYEKEKKLKKKIIFVLLSISRALLLSGMRTRYQQIWKLQTIFFPFLETLKTHFNQKLKPKLPKPNKPSPHQRRPFPSPPPPLLPPSLAPPLRAKFTQREKKEEKGKERKKKNRCARQNAKQSRNRFFFASRPLPIEPRKQAPSVTTPKMNRKLTKTTSVVKVSTVENIFDDYYGLQSGHLVVEGEILFFFSFTFFFFSFFLSSCVSSFVSRSFLTLLLSNCLTVKEGRNLPTSQVFIELECDAKKAKTNRTHDSLIWNEELVL